MLVLVLELEANWLNAALNVLYGFALVPDWVEPVYEAFTNIVFESVNVTFRLVKFVLKLGEL